MSHPEIVRVFACSEDSLHMDVMGMDLHKFMRRRMKRGTRSQPSSLAASIDLMLQIAEGISHIHLKKIAHRDLKPLNILVNPLDVADLGGNDGFVFAKIADFGLAKVKLEITRYSHLTQNVGTRKWMAPEVFKANLEDAHLGNAFPMKADVYSFAIICSETLSGKEPYSDVQPSELYSTLTAPFPLRPRLSPNCPTNLASLICACWDADPRKRPTFVKVRRVLRYLKALLTLTDWQCTRSIDGEWPYGRLTTNPKIEGPCRSRLSSSTLQPFRYLDIGCIDIGFSDCEHCMLSHFCVGSRGDACRTHIATTVDTGLIPFDQPSEFLVQMEGSTKASGDGSGSCVSSISFITTNKMYGPFGTDSGTRSVLFLEGLSPCIIRTIPISCVSDLVVGVLPDNVGCLRHFSENEDPFADLLDS